MGDNRLESRIIEHCAPTLAGMKSASLFNYFFHGQMEDVLKELTQVNVSLNERGVYAETLLWREKSVLIYVYRPKDLQAELNRPGVMELLAPYGYPDRDVNNCISYLKRKRLDHYECFPHEIGLFLGYPLEDVKGFIENKGQNCKSCGVWKVYCDEGEKQKLFDKFKKCTEVYLRVFGEGRQFSKMVVL